MSNLKKFGSLLALLVMFAMAGYSTLNAQVNARTLSMSQGVKDAVTLDLPTADQRMVERLWTDFVKDNFDNRNKRNRRSKEMEALNISIPLVSTTGNVDMYSVVNERGEGSELVIWIATNQGYVSPTETPDRYIETEKFLLRFALDVARAQLDEQIEDQEKDLRDMERDLGRMENEQERSRRAIEQARERIAEEERNIEQNIADQEAMRQQMETQRQLIQQTKDRKDNM
ncbi:MAG: hypothetical protein AAFO91_08235 [Bacteroidota bacterium]